MLISQHSCMCPPIPGFRGALIASRSDEHRAGDAAFGDDPGRWPLPPAPRRTNCGCARSPQAGRAATAAPSPTWTALRGCSAAGRWPRWRTARRASFLRQLGWHDRARGWDGRALALAGIGPRRPAPTP